MTMTNMATPSKDIKELTQDPRWGEVETLLESYMKPLMDFNTIDTTQPAEHVKAEVIGRRLAYNALADFLNDTMFVSNKVTKVVNPFA